MECRKVLMQPKETQPSTVMMSEDEDANRYQVPGAYSDSPIQESWAPLSYLRGLFPRLSAFVSLTINMDRVHRNHFQGPVNGFIADAETGTAYSQETYSDVRPATPRPAPESTPNPRAEYEIYYDQLLLRKRGCPLYCPGPIVDLPIQYRKSGCRLGDIGILCGNGTFDYLFNILYPAYHPINRGRVPRGFAPAVIRRDVAAGQALDCGSILANPCIRGRDGTDFGLDADLIFETESEIAVLVLPGGSKFQNLLSSGCLKKYIKTHAAQWYSYILEERGRMGVRNGDVRLIIGIDKAPSWGIATRACSQKPGIFGVKKSALSGSFEAAWYCPEGVGNGKSGPRDDEIKDLRNSTDPPLENQTAFIRFMNFTPTGEISDYPDSTALQLRPSTSSTEAPSNLVSFQGSSSLGSASSSNHPSSRVGDSQVGHQRGVISLTHFELPVVHPSTYLNQFLLDKFPNAKIAITDDWDWISVIREDDLVFPTAKDLCQRVLSSCKFSEENGIATILRSSDDPSSLRDPALAVDDPTVAYLRDEALSSLRIQCALSALVDSVERVPPPRCAPFTRQAITVKIEKWAKNTSIDDTSEIFWLTGGAGAGKSAVAQSVAELFKQESILAAGFFFNSASNVTNNGASLIPTLVFQLLEVLPGLKPVVEDCINSDPHLFSNLWDVQEVAQKLFIEPLNILHIANPGHNICPPLMVIDGLDECHDPEFQCKLLRIIANAILEVPYPFRLLITSRLEDHLVKSFAALQTVTVHRWNLSDDPDADCDIHDFFEQQLEEIKCTHPFRARLPTVWPGEEVLITLVDMSSQHFIYASTVVEYIQSPKHSPEERLKIALGLSPPAAKLDRPFFQLDFLYSSIFQTLGKDHLQELHNILGLRRVIDDSSSANDGFFQWQSGSEFLFFASSSDPGFRTPLYIIETLLKIRPCDVELVLSPLRSLVSLDDRDVRVLHKSLFEYLLDSSRSGDFHLNLSIPHMVVTKYIVENWVSFPRYPFAGPTQFTNNTRDGILAYHLKASGFLKDDYPIFESPPAYHSIGSPTFKSLALPPYHPDPSPASERIQNPVNSLSLPVLRRRISLFLKSTTEHHHPHSDKPSATLETDHDEQAWSVEYKSDVRPRPDMIFVHTFVHDGARVYAVRFSPDGYYLAIGLGTEGLNNGMVVIYDVRTGTMICALVKHLEATGKEKVKTAVRSVCFSPDSRYCVIGDSRGIIKVWVIARKRMRNAFVGHTSAVTSLDCSPNGQLLASASLDGSIRIWNIRDGFSKVLTKNADYFYSVKFSPNGQYVATTNIDKILRVWHIRTGRLVDWWIGNTAAVDSIAFTPSGRGLVGGGWDRTVSYWDVSLLGWGSEASSDGRHENLRFEGHNDRVFSIAISPDERWVVSGSRDGSAIIWDVNDGTQQCTLRGHEGAIRSVDFSPGGNYLAVGTHDGRVSLWKYEQLED